MRKQFLSDGLEHFDFHVGRRTECQKLSQLILEGDYVPSRAQRILVEKSKGLCRQIVIPSARDALVLQCLSDALYSEIRGKAPTDRSFFEPEEHRFSNVRSEYGTFASWLNFQRELFNFSKTRDFVVVTDIANYYDTISYHHLRNVISSISGVEECVLDMLIYILADLLWQPDYTPRIEVGLPQINLDAPRLLAHCFLYELDAYLASDSSRDFVRYMDDIDIGVDSAVAAKQILKSVDLVLQTKQVRLNSGKTKILTRLEAQQHFRIFENARLDRLRSRVDRKRAAGLPLDRERRLIQQRLRRGLARAKFDQGNGEKILKRWIGLASITGSRIQPEDLRRLILLRPTVRENVFAYIMKSDLTEARARVLASTAGSGHLVDDASLIDLANHLVETAVTTRHNRHEHISTIIGACNEREYYSLYAKLWLQSKYDSPTELLSTIQRTYAAWRPHDRFGRLIGALTSVFSGTPEDAQYLDVLNSSRNAGVREAYKFHTSLLKDADTFRSMYDALRNPNSSKGTGITHPKYLCLLAALRNPNASSKQITALKTNNAAAFRDIYYRQTARRCGAL